MANPLIRKHLHFYPEDAGSRLREAWQGQCWLHELSPHIVSQMIRVDHQDYYIHEPAKLCDGMVVVPMRWYMRKSSSGEQLLYGEGRQLVPVGIPQGRQSYVVLDSSVVHFAATDLSLCLSNLIATYQSDGLPDPRSLIGVLLL